MQHQYNPIEHQNVRIYESTITAARGNMEYLVKEFPWVYSNSLPNTTAK